MTLKIANKTDSKSSENILQTYYQNDFMPAEKKKYLTDLKNGTGPYLPIISNNGTSYIQDAASQIATLGLGLNATSFFGQAHHIESWYNRIDTDFYDNFLRKYTDFFKRKLNWKDLHIKLCNSGAEANEIALGNCYQDRLYKDANQVLAFEGSFHGRMLTSLFSTWNKIKREPFQWQGHETTYLPYPEIKSSDIIKKVPKQWKEFWENSTTNKLAIPKEWKSNPELSLEVESLLEIKNAFSTNKYFAIILEPMQCEGGDRYSTNRFHTGLLILSKIYNVKVVYDEVQTGFHLGREFFWHTEFNISDSAGVKLLPDYITCAKKAQTGIVISPRNILFNNSISIASALRGYAHAIILDQNHEKIIALEKKITEKLNQFAKNFKGHVNNPRGAGMAFGIDFVDKEKMLEFITKRFDFGLLYYPAGDSTLRFRANLSYKKEDIDFLFDNLTALGNTIFNKSKESLPIIFSTKYKSPKSLYLWQEKLLCLKNDLFNEQAQEIAEIKDWIENQFSADNLKLNFVDQTNFKDFKEKIISLEEKIYEPARQTSIDVFEKAASAKINLFLALTNNKNELVGLAVTSSVKDHPLEKGLRNDPNFLDDKTVYMIDTTIDTSLQGLGIGRKLKYALQMLAPFKDIVRVNGRNRDRLANTMLNINISLGAIEEFYIKEDYLDFEQYRDVIYYSSKTSWQRPELSLSNSVNSPLDNANLENSFLTNQLPYSVNKVCLSNFVSERFLKDLKSLVSLAPTNLQHAYTTSGQSETVDKVIRSIWFEGDFKSHKIITFKGHYFGEGSFLSRDLSQIGDSFFDVTVLENPTDSNYKEILANLTKMLSKNEYLSIFLEPVLQRTMEKVPHTFLKELKTLSNKYKCPIVYNETASSRFHYNGQNFYAANDDQISPNAMIQYLGGQVGICLMTKEYYVEKPLMLISTWDGDEFSLNNYIESLKVDEKLNRKLIIKDFTQNLKLILDKYELNYKLENGIGSIRGHIPLGLSRLLNKMGDNYIICPTTSSANIFNTQYSKGLLKC